MQEKYRRYQEIYLKYTGDTQEIHRELESAQAQGSSAIRHAGWRLDGPSGRLAPSHS
jgi:hypothetical protein